MAENVAQEIVISEPEMSDEAIRRGSGKGWSEWCELLDAADGTTKKHGELAQLAYDNGAPTWWWAHGVAVGYARIRGMRKVNESPSGFTASASKTIAVPVDMLYAAWEDEAIRDCWLEPGTLRWRTGTPSKSGRLDFPEAGTILGVYFTVKGEAKSSVQVQQEKLTSTKEVAEQKLFWKERLDRLATLLKSDQ